MAFGLGGGRRSHSYSRVQVRVLGIVAIIITAVCFALVVDALFFEP